MEFAWLGFGLPWDPSLHFSFWFFPLEWECLSYHCILERLNLSSFTGSQLEKNSASERTVPGDFPTSNAVGPGSITGQGTRSHIYAATKSLHATIKTRYNQIKIIIKKKKRTVPGISLVSDLEDILIRLCTLELMLEWVKTLGAVGIECMYFACEDMNLQGPGAECYGLNCVLSKFICWSPTSNVTIWR